jgi:DNA-binding CsgD family transcriptional regulator
VSEDEAAVLAVIAEEHRAFWMKDEPAFVRCHLHSADTLRWGYWQAGGFMYRRGWSEIGPRSLAHMRRLPRPVPEFVEAPVENLIMHVGRDVAWLSFDRVNPHIPGIFGHGPNGTTNNIAILEKHDGRWLIAVLALLDQHLGDEAAVRVGADGRVVWTSVAARERLGGDEHFILGGGRLRARDARTDRRLAAAVAWAAGQDGDLMPRRGQVPLHLQSYETGLPRVVWVLADVASAIVLLEDSRPLDERVALATHAFGFSDAQARLALALAGGMTLADHARRAAISMNTARTHLKRTFEKAGVTSQAGLVRMLAALTPPR